MGIYFYGRMSSEPVEESREGLGAPKAEILDHSEGKNLMWRMAGLRLPKWEALRRGKGLIPLAKRGVERFLSRAVCLV